METALWRITTPVEQEPSTPSTKQTFTSKADVDCWIDALQCSNADAGAPLPAGPCDLQYSLSENAAALLVFIFVDFAASETLFENV